MELIVDIFVLVFSVYLCAVVFRLAQATVAIALGDRSPIAYGALKFSPASVLLPIQSFVVPLCLLFTNGAYVGWGREPSFSSRSFKYPTLYSLLTLLSGIICLLVLGFSCHALLQVHFLINADKSGILVAFIKGLGDLSLMMVIFHMFPVPPWTGGKIISLLLRNDGKNLWLEKMSLYSDFLYFLALGWTFGFAILIQRLN